MDKNNQLETAPIGKLVFKLAIPTVMAQLVNLLYNIVDRIYVGRIPEIGSLSLAGLGVTFPIILLVSAFAMLAGMGGASRAAVSMGEKDNDKAEKILGNCTMLLIIFSVVLAVVFMLTKNQILMKFGASEATLPYASDYISIYLVGTIFVQIALGLNLFITNQGFAKTSMMTVCIGAVLNIVLDLVFIIVFKLGAPGAAWATIISQGVSGVLCLVYIWKFVPELRMKKEDWYFRRNLAAKQIGVGIPMGLQYSITAIGTMMVQSALNMLGSYAVAAFTAGSKIEQIFTQAYVAQGTASATYNAQNIGAGKLERVREGFRASHFIGIVYSVVVGSFLFFAGKYFAYLFISDNIEEVLPMVAIYVKCVALFFIPLYFVNVLRNGIQGMGYGLLPMMAGVAELAGRGITATIAAGKSSYVGTCLASPVAWVFASVLLWGMYFYVMKDMSRKLYGTNKL